MSKPTFRARTLDSAKPMPILRESREELTPEIIAQMSTSALTMQPPVLVAAMDKEEERETHLQRALDAQQVLKASAASVAAIPIPEIIEDPDAYLMDYEVHHRDVLRPQKQYINLQALLDDEGECYEYDLDSEDEAWLDDWTRKLPATSTPQSSARLIEAALQRFEQSSERTVCSLDEARALAKDLDEDTVLALYNHWTTKRQRLKHPLLLEVRTEKHDGSNSNNPYIAFRKRCEKMQTRKNRKNDELSYIRMLRLRRDMERAIALLQFVLQREEGKRNAVCFQHQIVKTRFALKDFDGRILNEATGASTPSGKSPVRASTPFLRKEQEDASAIPPPPPITPASTNRLKGKNKSAQRAAALAKEVSKPRAPSPLQPARSRTLVPAKHPKPGRSSRTPSASASATAAGGERGESSSLAERVPGVGSIVNTSLAAFQQPPHSTAASASSLVSTAPVLPPKSLLPSLLDLNANAQASRPKPPSFESPDGIFAFNPLPGALYLPAKSPASPPRASSGTSQIFKVCDAAHPSIPSCSPFASHSQQTHSTAHSLSPASSPSKRHRIELQPSIAKQAAFLTSLPVNDSNRLAYCRLRVGRLGRRIMDQFSIEAPSSGNHGIGNSGSHKQHRSNSLTQRILNRMHLNHELSVHRSALACSSLYRSLSSFSERARASSRAAAAGVSTSRHPHLPHSRSSPRRHTEVSPPADPALSLSRSTDRRDLSRLGELVLDELPDALEPRDACEPVQKRLRVENALPVCSLLRSSSAARSSICSSDVAHQSGRLESEFLDALQSSQMNLFKPSATAAKGSTSCAPTRVFPAWPKYPPSMRSLADAHEKKQEADEAAAAAAAYLAPVTPPANFALPDFMREIC